MLSDASEHIDLRKKMKRMCMTATMMILAWPLAHSQSQRFMTGIDVLALAGGEATFSIEYGISGHWSAGGRISYGFGTLLNGPHDLEIIHRQEFGDTLTLPKPDDYHRESLYVKYWPVQLARGPYLLTGISQGTASRTRLNIGAGFLQHIWKHINIYTEYRLSIPENELCPNGLSAGVYLTFGMQK